MPFTVSKKALIFSFSFIILVFIAGLRPVGLDADSIQYSFELFKNISDLDFLSKEPTFWLLQQANLALFNGAALSFFLLYASIGVFIKFLAISRISPFPYLSIMVYVVFFFILQEMTQIRAGIAIGLVFWSMIDVITRNKVNFSLKILFAMLFHYSAIIFLFLYLIRSKFGLKEFVFYFSLPLFGIFLMYSGFLQVLTLSFSSHLPSFLGFKIELYFQLMEQDKIKVVSPVNFGNVLLLVALYFAMFMVFFTPKKDLNYEVVILSIKWLSVGFLMLFSFSFIEVFAYRMANYMFFSLVIILPFVFTRFKPVVLSVSMFLIYLSYIFYSTMQMLNFESL